MRKIKRLLLWYLMFLKRLFKRYSFIVILLIIPILIPVAKTVMSEDSGMVTVALCSEDINDETAATVIERLTEEDSVMRYRIFEDKEAAIEAVKKSEVDAAWIFPEDLRQKIEAFATRQSKKPFVDVVQREETTSLGLAREKLYGAMYSYIAFDVLKAYSYMKFITPMELPERTLEQMYVNTDKYDDIINIKRLDSDEVITLNKNFLTIPLRGLLALVVMLCGMASAMYFIRDCAEGKFDWLSPKKRLAPAFGSCFAATSSASVAVFLALLVSGIFENPGRESLSIFLYMIASAGFCLVLCTLFSSAGKLGATIPFFMIVMIVLCPIIFNLNFLKPIQHMLPPYYYLLSLYNDNYIFYMICYCVCVYVLAYILNLILANSKRRIRD